MGKPRRKKRDGDVQALDLGALEHSKIHEEVLVRLRMQLLIVLVNRLGGKVDIPMSEVDGTGQFLLGYQLVVPRRPTGDIRLDAGISGIFKFEVRKKQ